MGEAVWHCCRVRAGPLVKECRAIRPRFSQSDTALDHRAKAELKKYQRCAVNRKQVDRLELRLALLGPLGTHYTMTYDNDHLPEDFAGARRSFRNFIARVDRSRGGKKWPYCYAVEGKHGDHRLHIHYCAPYEIQSPAEVAYYWRNGDVDNEPILRTRRYQDPTTGAWMELSDGGFRRLAEYLNKERPDGFFIPIGRHPWGASRMLNAMVPAPEVWMDESNLIEIPDNALWARRSGIENDFGAYYFGSWIDGREYW